METTHYFLRILAASQSLFIGVYFLSYYRDRTGWFFTLLAVCISCYLLLPPVHAVLSETLVVTVLKIGATAIPAMLWLLVQRFLNDNQTTPIWFWFVFASYMVLSFLGPEDAANTTLTSVIFVLLPQFLKLGLVVHVIYLAASGIKSDLVEQRRQIRAKMSITLGLICILVISVELWAGGNVPMFIELMGSVLLVVATFLANLFLFRLRSDILPFATKNLLKLNK